MRECKREKMIGGRGMGGERKRCRVIKRGGRRERERDNEREGEMQNIEA